MPIQMIKNFRQLAWALIISLMPSAVSLHHPD